MNKTKEKVPGTAATVQSTKPKVQDNSTVFERVCKEELIIKKSIPTEIDDLLFQIDCQAKLIFAIREALEYGSSAGSDYSGALYAVEDRLFYLLAGLRTEMERQQNTIAEQQIIDLFRKSDPNSLDHLICFMKTLPQQQ